MRSPALVGLPQKIGALRGPLWRNSGLSCTLWLKTEKYGFAMVTAEACSENEKVILIRAAQEVRVCCRQHLDSRRFCHQDRQAIARCVQTVIQYSTTCNTRRISFSPLPFWGLASGRGTGELDILHKKFGNFPTMRKSETEGRSGVALLVGRLAVPIE
ncbi:hypothetical protein BJX68DRAFT_50260 [Aspergillus pseudodeflectus]|uniref:Uncharacterized protein n=1 Tax=Aspergillus pseudodeflectus TaxID=176178 RepID=A0ABR4KLB3_9EURO